MKESKKIEKATFALGCFWGPDDFFSKLKGVTKTTVGYTGGKKLNPTYNDLGDNTESIEIKFDPSLVSYKELLSHFWEQHNPTISQKTQYKSIIFFHNKYQEKIANKSKQEQEEKIKQKIVTEIRKASKFYPAEEYHQKYYKKHKITRMLRVC